MCIYTLIRINIILYLRLHYIVISKRKEEEKKDQT